jgi:hypothetical protein
MVVIIVIVWFWPLVGPRNPNPPPSSFSISTFLFVTDFVFVVVLTSSWFWGAIHHKTRLDPSAKTSARATPSRIFHLIRRIFTHVFFSSESTVPRAFADRFVRVKSIYYLVPGIFVFAETLWMVCCIVSVWKI